MQLVEREVVWRGGYFDFPETIDRTYPSITNLTPGPRYHRRSGDGRSALSSAANLKFGGSGEGLRMERILTQHFPSCGHVEAVAKAVVAGATVGGAQVDGKRVDQTAPEDVARGACFRSEIELADGRGQGGIVARTAIELFGSH